MPTHAGVSALNMAFAPFRSGSSHAARSPARKSPASHDAVLRGDAQRRNQGGGLAGSLGPASCGQSQLSRQERVSSAAR